MSPHTSTGDNEAARRIPLNICHTVVFDGLHQLQVGSKILLTLGLLALEVNIPEVQVEVRLRVDSSDHNEAALGRPVDTVAGLLLDRAHQLKVSSGDTLLFRGKEGNRGLGRDGGTGGGLAGGDDNET